MPKFVQKYYFNMFFYNSITEANTYFITYETEERRDIKIKVVNNKIDPSKKISKIQEYLILKLHHDCTNNIS